MLPGCAQLVTLMTEFFQIYYREQQKEKLYPFAIPIYNEKLTIFFENSVISNLVEASQAKKIAVCSWKLRDKLRWYIGRPRELTMEVLESDYEVLSFTKNTKHHHMLAAASAWHPGFKETFEKILNMIGVKAPSEVKIPIYQNHFSASTHIYRGYVYHYLDPSMDVIKNDPEINRMAMSDSNYSDLTNKKANHLKEKLGIDYYPLVPFLLERLFSVFVHNEKISVTHL